MTEAERKSIDNAIWLCGPCSEIIDREESAYSVILLKKWKKDAESYARITANQRVYNQTELNSYAQQHILNYFKNPQSILSSYEHPFCLNTLARSITEALLQIDDRVRIDVSYINNTQHFSIKNNPQTKNLEPVEIRFKSLPTLSNEDKWVDFINHGLPIEIQMDSVTSNSEALKIIFPSDSDHIHARFDKSINQTLIIKDLDDNFIEEFNGKTFIGKDTFSFESKIHQNLLSLNIDKISHSLSNLTSFMKLNLELKIWDNKDLRSLTKFSQILSFYKKISKLKSIKVYALYENRELFIAKLSINSNELNYVYNLMNYINVCRKIAQTFNLEIYFERNAEFTSDEHKRLHYIFEDVESTEIQKHEIKNKPNFTINVDSDEQKKNLEKLLETTNGLQLKKEVKELNVKMFSSTFDIEYTIECEFHNYLLDRTSLSSNTYEIGIDFIDNGLFKKNMVNSKVFIK